MGHLQHPQAGVIITDIGVSPFVEGDPVAVRVCHTPKGVHADQLPLAIYARAVLQDAVLHVGIRDVRDAVLAQNQRYRPHAGSGNPFSFQNFDIPGMAVPLGIAQAGVLVLHISISDLRIALRVGLHGVELAAALIAIYGASFPKLAVPGNHAKSEAIFAGAALFVITDAGVIVKIHTYGGIVIDHYGMEFDRLFLPGGPIPVTVINVSRTVGVGDMGMLLRIQDHRSESRAPADRGGKPSIQVLVPETVPDQALRKGAVTDMDIAERVHPEGRVFSADAVLQRSDPPLGGWKQGGEQQGHAEAPDRATHRAPPLFCYRKHKASDLIAVIMLWPTLTGVPPRARCCGPTGRPSRSPLARAKRTEAGPQSPPAART